MRWFFLLFLSLTASAQFATMPGGLLVPPVAAAGGGGGANNAYLSNYWKMDDSAHSMVSDSVDGSSLWSSSDNNLWPDSVAGHIGTALNFSSAHTTTAFTNNVFAPKNLAWSVSGWFKLTTAEAAGAIITVGALSARGILIEQESADSKLHLYGSTTDTTWDKSVASTATLSTAVWYFFAGIHDPTGGGSLTLYIGDSSSMLSTNTTSSVGALSANSSGVVYLGSRFSSDGWFNGALDEIAYWNTALTATQVAAEWNNGSGVTHP